MTLKGSKAKLSALLPSLSSSSSSLVNKEKEKEKEKGKEKGKRISSLLSTPNTTNPPSVNSSIASSPTSTSYTSVRGDNSSSETTSKHKKSISQSSCESRSQSSDFQHTLINVLSSVSLRSRSKSRHRSSHSASTSNSTTNLSGNDNAQSSRSAIGLSSSKKEDSSSLNDRPCTSSRSNCGQKQPIGQPPTNTNVYGSKFPLPLNSASSFSSINSSASARSPSSFNNYSHQNDSVTSSASNSPYLSSTTHSRNASFSNQPHSKSSYSNSTAALRAPHLSSDRNPSSSLSDINSKLETFAQKKPSMLQPAYNFNQNQSSQLQRQPSNESNRPDSASSAASSCSIPSSPTSSTVKETNYININIDPVSGHKLINTYEILSELGRGQHGKVKLARNIETSELVVSIFR